MMADEKTAVAVATFAQLRLRKHADYQRAYDAASKQHTREMSFFYARRDAMPARRLHPSESAATTGPRVGLTVGKVMGKAHDRNRIKRRLRAAVALHAKELAGLPVDVILHPRRTVLLLEWAKLQREVQQVFRSVRNGSSASPGPAQPQKEQGGKSRKRKPAKKANPAAGAAR